MFIFSSIPFKSMDVRITRLVCSFRSTCFALETIVADDQPAGTLPPRCSRKMKFVINRIPTSYVGIEEPGYHCTSSELYIKYYRGSWVIVRRYHTSLLGLSGPEFCNIFF